MLEGLGCFLLDSFEARVFALLIFLGKFLGKTITVSFCVFTRVLLPLSVSRRGLTAIVEHGFSRVLKSF